MLWRCLCAFSLCVFLATCAFGADGPKKIVLIAGKKSHGPEGNGIHDYPWSVKLLKVMLDNSNIADKVKVEYHLDGFPSDPKTLDDADTILIVSDGRDGDLYDEAPHFASPANLALIERQVHRGCGFAVIHFSTFGPDKYASQSFEWTGGYFDWEENGQRKWYSAIETRNAEVSLATPKHPLLRGVKPFKMKEEFYFNIRFAEGDQGVTPLWTVADLPGRDDRGDVVAWAKERKGGGRGFGTTCGHFYSNWEHEEFRTLILNALVWTAGLEPPETGVKARYYSRNEISAALSGVKGTERAVFKEEPIRVLILAGNEAHEWHNWKKTTPVIKALLEVDGRIKVDISNDPEDFGRDKLKNYQVVVQNYANWHDNKPLSDRARQGFADFIAKGGGLVLVHFANGAWNFSLPMAGESDWPEYRKIVRRVWNHAGKGESQSGHDAFGKFRVTPTRFEHEITRGIAPFEIEDELYYRQDGAEPIEPLITATSKDTQRDEPLAWTYRYGEGRVFQTLLGHSEKTYDAFGPREMLRRAVAWAAKKPAMRLEEKIEAQLLPVLSQPQPAPPPKVSAERLIEGKFGKALNGSDGGALLPAIADLRNPPLTVDAWVKLDEKEGFNILVASEEKSSANHWELYTYAGSGVLSAYLPGRGGEYKSPMSIVDGRWRHVAMQLDKDRIALYVDGEKILDSPLKETFTDSKSGALAVGRLVEGGIGCSGAIDELRFRRGIVEIAKPTAEPAKSDEATLLLWRFDELKEGKLQDASSFKRHEGAEPPVQAAPPKNADAPKPKEGHWSYAGVGFDWKESDSADARWQQTKHGRWLASILPLSKQTLAKGLTLRLGPEKELCAAYDTQSASLRAVWSGGFLKFDPARYGIIAPPRPDGAMQLEIPADLGWGDSTGAAAIVEYRALRMRGEQVEFEYRAAGTTIRETPWTTRSEKAAIGLLRTLEIEPHAAPLVLWLTEQAKATQNKNGVDFTVAPAGFSELRLHAKGENISLAKAVKNGREIFGITIPASNAPAEVKLAYGFGVAPSETAREAGSIQPKRIYKTQGARAADDAALVLDRIGIPFENEDKSLFFVTGHDFLAKDKLAVCTLHGDVWIVEGVDDDLQEITWTRYATGLFQPLGLRIQGGQIYVLGRDQITRLVDEDQDGVADRYENFCNLWDTSTGGHDYITCLETDSHGNFYFLDAVKGVQKVSPDGKKIETVATGLRNPNGLGISPRDEITAAPQEGEWTPASFVAYARPGDHFGYLGPKVSADRPLGFNAPLLYFSRRLDNSCAGQVWIPDGAFGSLGGKMLHLSFGQCKLLLVHEETVNGVRQAGASSLPFDFDSGIMRGRFNSFDGGLYVGGSRGWVTRAAQDGCLTRVRYTGKPFIEAPIAAESRGNGFVLTFDAPLDPQIATDPGSYRIESWNYRYSSGYGSRDYKVSTGDEGRDEIEVLSASLSEDGKTLSLRTPPLQPANQVSIEYRLRTADGKTLKQSYLHTLHAVSSKMLPEAPSPNSLAFAGLTEESAKKLQTGLAWTFQSANQRDTVSRRMAALHVEPDEPPTHFLPSGSFIATAQGWLAAPFSDEYTLELEGSGRASLTIAGKNIWSGEIAEGRPAKIANVRLSKGYNPIYITFESSPRGAGRLRVLWKGDGFPLEPLPPTALFHLPQREDSTAKREGLRVFGEHLCIQCHTISSLAATSSTSLKTWFAAPKLKEISSRLQQDWVAAWIASPSDLRPQARMPHLLGDNAKADAADLAAYLYSSSAAPASSALEVNEAEIAAGAQLYETLGCISCHCQTPPNEADAHNRISLHYVANKFTPSGLIAFIKNPTANAPASRMPDFGLSDDEAQKLAAYLVDKTKTSALPEKVPAKGDAARGKKLYFEHRCASCHEETSPPQPLIAIADLQKGCLSPVNEGAVRLNLAPSEKAAVRSLLSLGEKQVSLQSRADTLALLLREYRCTSCHDRDLAFAPRRALIEEEGESGQPAPPIPNLTWTGDKLRDDWLQHFFAGEVKIPARPWLAARMPRFPAIAQPLAEGLAAEHGRLPHQAPSAETFDKQQAELGFALSAPDQLDCRQCHAIGALKPRGDEKSQIALGINFALTRDRLHADFFDRFLLDPPRYDLGTRMPKLAEEGRTRALTILQGDAKAQFDALWQFIRSIPPSEGK